MLAHENGAAMPPVLNVHARWFFGASLVVWTDPRKLTLRLHDRVRAGEDEIRLSERFLDAADWTDVIGPVVDIAEHGETAELVQYRADYAEMPAFRTMLDRIGKNKPIARYGMRLDSEEKLHAYFRYFLELIDSIKAHGFRDQRSLQGVPVPQGLMVRGRYSRRQRDIGAALGEDGRLLRFLGGRHRTAIAQALRLPAIPVEIRLVHADWLAAEARRAERPADQALRNWAARNSLPEPR